MCLIADVYKIEDSIRELAVICCCFSFFHLSTLDASAFFSSFCVFHATVNRFYLKVPRCDLFGLVRIIYDTRWNWNSLGFCFSFFFSPISFGSFSIAVAYFPTGKSLNGIMALSISRFPFESRLGLASYALGIFVFLNFFSLIRNDLDKKTFCGSGTCIRSNTFFTF